MEFGYGADTADDKKEEDNRYQDHIHVHPYKYFTRGERIQVKIMSHKLKALVDHLRFP